MTSTVDPINSEAIMLERALSCIEGTIHGGKEINLTVRTEYYRVKIDNIYYHARMTDPAEEGPRLPRSMFSIWSYPCRLLLERLVGFLTNSVYLEVSGSLGRSAYGMQGTTQPRRNSKH